MLVLDGIEKLQAIESASLQPDVEEDEVRSPRRDLAERIVTVTRRARGVAFVLENASDQLADVRFIVDDEDVKGHVNDSPPELWVQVCFVCCPRRPALPRTAAASRRRAARALSQRRRAVRSCRRVPRECVRR